MQTLTRIKELLAARGLAPRKSLGQNFLIDQNLIRKLVDAAGVGPSSLVLEVGPGTGTLTEELLDRGCEVVACELDAGLAAVVRETVAPAHPGRLTVIEGDCLASKRALAPAILAALKGRPFQLVSNLPYNAGTPLMLTLLTGHPECRSLHVTVQREVADRVLAGPGSKDYGTLGIVTAAVATAERLATLPPECFWPRPEVTSGMIGIVRRDRALTENPAGLAAFCQRVFSARRKQLGSVLGREGPWPPGVRPEDRAESVPVESLIELCRGRGCA